jgi:hypothetical protein
MKKTASILIVALYASLIIGALVGEVKCIVKAFNCNWEPIGKAEIVYTASACCGLGAIVGWMDIKDK